MSVYEKIVTSGGKMPRKLKKRIQKIPVGSYCYGSFIGSKGRMIDGKRTFKGGSCVYHHQIRGMYHEDDGLAYCSFMHKLDDFLLADSVKICPRFEQFFPEFKDTEEKRIKRVKHEELMKARPEGIGVIEYLLRVELAEQRKAKHEEKTEN